MNPEAKRPEPASDVGLDEALAGTFPASDPVAPPSHVEEEMERRRRVLEEDAANKRKRDASEEALDEGLRETFPASDPVAVHHREAPPSDADDAHRHEREFEPVSAPVDKPKQGTPKGQKKTPRRRARPTGRRTGQKKTLSKKRKSAHGARDTRRKKAPRKASARRKRRT